MRSELVTIVAHVVLLSCLGVWTFRKGQQRSLLVSAPAAIVLLSWWWITNPEPREGPDWLLVVLVALYTGGIIGVAKGFHGGDRGTASHLVLTILSGAMVVFASAILSFLIWGIVAAL